jgi:predicted small lipoprotein YifL
MKKAFTFLFSLIILTSITACHLPGDRVLPTESSPDAFYTHSAETMSAELTALASSVTLAPPSPTISPTSTSTSTPFYTPSNTPIPCLLVGYNAATIDVTVPDNTVMSPGQVFTKTWRLRNLGTCTWNSSYQMVFDHGDQMGVASSYSQPLTAGSVAPGKEVDVSVSLTAPMTPGTYTGYWRFRDPSNVYFGIGGTGAWVVIIKVVNAVSVTLTPVVGESGTIRSDGGPWPDYTAGESNADITKTAQTYLSYNISSIPAGATITEAKFDLTAYSTMGNPLPGLGVLNAYVTDFGATLDSADFVSGLPSGNVADWGSLAALNVIELSNELKAAVQSELGSSRMIIRLQFGGSNMDAVKDRITFTNPSIIIKYTAP